jgi:hypothetical protein
MPVTGRTTNARKHAVIAAAASALLLAVLVAAAWPGSADSAPLRVIVMGKTANPPQPECPKDPCRVEGRITAFQSLYSDGQSRPFEANFDGRIISWSISVAHPGKSNAAFFNSLFSRPSEARISVLRRLDSIKGKGPVFKLVRQSPLQVLNPYFGQTVEFALDHPLKVLKGQVVALTVPTWAPMFVGCDPTSGICPRGLGTRDTWRASRQPGKCSFDNLTPTQVKQRVQESHPQQRPKSKRLYGCYYSAARLLYNATLVKKP